MKLSIMIDCKMLETSYPHFQFTGRARNRKKFLMCCDVRKCARNEGNKLILKDSSGTVSYDQVSALIAIIVHFLFMVNKKNHSKSCGNAENTSWINLPARSYEKSWIDTNGLIPNYFNPTNSTIYL